MTFTCDDCAGPCTCGALMAAAERMLARTTRGSARATMLRHMPDVPRATDGDGGEPPAKVRGHGMEITAPVGFKMPFRATRTRRPKAWNDNTCDS